MSADNKNALSAARESERIWAEMNGLTVEELRYQRAVVQAQIELSAYIKQGGLLH